MNRPATAALSLLLVAGCTTLLNPRADLPARRTPPATPAFPDHCTAQDDGQLPDPMCTPGATNPDVTPATIGQTICRPGWVATVRPPTSYTSPLKRFMIGVYGDYAGTAPAGYELDHLVSLELGGAPRDVRNLWPERNYNIKDQVENAANRAVCAGRLTLPEAQRGIALNWIILGRQLHVPGVPAS